MRFQHVIVWPGVHAADPFGRLYLPFRYTDQVKRSGSRYSLRGVFGQDFVSALVAFAWLSPSFATVAAIAFFQVSFWTIYELGYYENDRLAATRESKGTVPTNFVEGGPLTPSPNLAWLYALGFGGAGAAFTVEALGPGGLWLTSSSPSIGTPVTILLVFILWSAYLALTRLGFAFYNYTAPGIRHLLYPFLQVLRLCGYGLFFATNVVGTIVIGAFIFGRWVPYLVYRVGGRRWGEANKLLVFIAFVAQVPAALATSGNGFLSVQAAAALSWLAFRARLEVKLLLAGLQFRLDTADVEHEAGCVPPELALSTPSQVRPTALAPVEPHMRTRLRSRAAAQAAKTPNQPLRR